MWNKNRKRTKAVSLSLGAGGGSDCSHDERHGNVCFTNLRTTRKLSGVDPETDMVGWKGEGRTKKCVAWVMLDQIQIQDQTKPY